ncbi:PhzF family phenazine biosynthesis protein [Actinoplanes sp. M2I2]|uniref:PhzF family phenazine biosynthesis protein n=1 Tax=Actinoplanes sp. M2I2 TaxID=1734444 RepID=UPI00202108C0|nr:PhzF family phenazine biosynthesis isomerase [Actinoplanes sp. M2I2]
MTEVLRYTAFSDDPAGGNPAGVVRDADELDDAGMLKIAADVGYSETAFVTHDLGGGRYRVRYFSPLIEVPFCGHATVATAVALGDGAYTFTTKAGDVPVTVEEGRATLTSVPPTIADLPPGSLAALLTALRWNEADLDPSLPPRVAYAGAHHPVIAVRTRERLADLDYDFEALKSLMEARGWTTIQLVHRSADDTFDVRNPFPVGGVVEDPATGAAAAALGGYLRALRLVPADATLHLRQGDDLGRPSRLLVRLVPGEAGVRVSGAAVPLA